MRLPDNCLTAALLVAMAIASSRSQQTESRQKKRQVTTQGLVVDTPQDRQPEATLVQAAASPLAAVHAHSKFFQDFFSVQLSPYKIEFGHVCEDPNTWEQRYERKDFKNHRDMGKVRWGDKHGGYGEHYWDYNHAGHGGDHHDEPSDNVHEYEEYESDGNRNKRDSKHHAGGKYYHRHHRPDEHHQVETRHQEDTGHQADTRHQADTYNRQADAHHHAADSHHHLADTHNHQADTHHQTEPIHPEESTKRLRKEVPKTKVELYLDETSGRIVDKTTGQAYTLQPV